MSVSSASKRGEINSTDASTEIRADEVIRCSSRVIILVYKLSKRTKYPLADRAHQVDRAARSTTSSKPHSVSSIADIIGSAGFSSKERKKFPKELIPQLELALKRIVMRQDPLYDEIQIRSTFGVFYGYYTSEVFQKTIKDSRKIEDLILMFISKSTGELQKSLADEDLKQTVDQHVARFIRLLLHLLKTHKIVNSDSDLVVKLSEYEHQLLRNATILTTNATSSGAQISTQNELNNIECNINTIPLLLQLKKVFELSISEMQDLIDTVKPDCTEEAALCELKLRLDDIQSERAPAYTSAAFLSAEAYLKWRQEEIQALTRSVHKLISENHNLAGVRPKFGPMDELAKQRPNSHHDRLNSSSSNISEMSKRMSTFSLKSISDDNRTSAPFIFSPTNPLISYKLLMHKCLRYELQTIVEPVDESDLSEPVLLSKKSLDLLTQIRTYWRISMTAHNITFLSVCAAEFVQNNLHIEDLDNAFKQVKVDGLFQDSELTRELVHIHQQSLIALNECLFRDLYGDLQRVFESKVDTRALTVLDEHIYSDTYFLEGASGIAEMFDELEKGIEIVAAKAYKDLRQKLCSLDSLEVLHIVKLSQTLEDDIKRFRKRFQQPILDVISIPVIYLRVCLQQFLYDLKPLLEQCYRNIKLQNAEFAIEDMFSLYREIVKVHMMLRQEVPEFRSPVNVDLFFRPFVLRWLQQAHTTIVAMVPRALGTDTFTVEDAQADGQLNSLSIVLLFKSFNQHLQFLRELVWPDAYWSAKFMTSLTQIFSEAVKEYSSTLWQLFSTECALSDSQKVSSDMIPESFQQRLIARARDAIAKRESVENFHISSGACVMLNNIEWAKTHLDNLEHNINSASLCEILERYEGPKDKWKPGHGVLFFVKVVSAQNLASCDSDGNSDPYTVLSDHKGRRIGKTRTMHSDLNPLWNETFEVKTSEPLWLAATVWDRDTNGEHDVCGRCYFKLDPRYFDDQIAKDFFIDLDTQGVLHLKITMEIETDGSIFYFSRAFRSLEIVENDMSRLIVNKMSPVILIFLTRSRVKSLISKAPSIDVTLETAKVLLNKASLGASKFALERNKAILSNQEMEAPIEPLMQYLDDNFRTLDNYLNRNAFVIVLNKLWGYVLSAIESLIIPPLYKTRKGVQSSLSEEEVDVVYKWLAFLKDTFAGDGGGLLEEDLQTFQYHEILSIRFFYFDETAQLMQECERMSVMSTKHRNAHVGPIHRKAYNLGTIKSVREKKLAQRRVISDSEDIMLRVLRMRRSRDAQSFVDKRISERQRESKHAVAAAGLTRRKEAKTRLKAL